MNNLNYGDININSWCLDGIIKAKVFKKKIHERTYLKHILQANAWEVKQGFIAHPGKTAQIGFPAHVEEVWGP